MTVIAINGKWLDLDDEEFIQEARSIVTIVQRQDIILLEILWESLARGLCFRRGFTSPLHFGTEGMGLTRDQAAKRLQIIDAMIRVPEIFDMLTEGKTTFTHLSIVAPKISQFTSDVLLKSVSTMTTRELRRFVRRVSSNGLIFDEH